MYNIDINSKKKELADESPTLYIYILKGSRVINYTLLYIYL